MSESFPCLFTKHLTKKRKTWLDGRISVNFKSGSCSLFHAPDDRSTSTACLDQLETPLTADQLRRIRGGEELEIVFDSHLVTLEVPVAEPTLPPLKVPKFVPPRIVPPAPKPPPAASTSSVVAHRVQQPPSNGRGHYSVDTGEVDSYWGGDDDDEAETGSSERASTSALPVAAHASRAEGHWEVNQEHVQPASSDSGHRVQRYEDEGDIWAEPSVPTPQKAQHQQQPPSRSVHAEAEDKTVAEWRGDGGVGVESDSPIQPNHTSSEGGAAPAPAVAVAAAAEEEDIWGF